MSPGGARAVPAGRLVVTAVFRTVRRFLRAAPLSFITILRFFRVVAVNRRSCSPLIATYSCFSVRFFIYFPVSLSVAAMFFRPPPPVGSLHFVAELHFGFSVGGPFSDGRAMLFSSFHLAAA